MNSRLLLPIAETDHFHCPGEAIPVSRAVHVARQASGWRACQNCVWNDAVDGDNSTESESQARPAAIRRTEFGVRGEYLNAIDRFRGSQLAAVFSSHLRRLHDLRQRQTHSSIRISPEPSDASPPSPVVAELNPVVVVGFDSRSGSPDVFTGVLSAVRQNGCHVLDAGRCTASSILNVCRIHNEIIGAIFVTGAGASAGCVGLDVFMADGHSISIPWHDYSIPVRSHRPQNVSLSDSELSSPMAQRLHDIRSLSDGAATATGNAAGTKSPHHWPKQTTDRHSTLNSTSPSSQASLAEREAELVLDALGSDQGRRFRSGRHSGSLRTVESEGEYRRWLSRWWKGVSTVAVDFEYADELTADRLRHLLQFTPLQAAVRRKSALPDSNPSTLGEHSETPRIPVITIDEDDRFLTVRSRHGRTLKPTELANWMNSAVRNTSAHVTAHVAASPAQLVLIDVAGPQSARQEDIITDALAITGFILQLLTNGKNALPC